MPTVIQRTGGNALDQLLATFQISGQGLQQPTSSGFIWGQYSDLPNSQRFWSQPHIVATGNNIGYDVFGPASGTINNLFIELPHVDPVPAHIPNNFTLSVTGASFSVAAFRAALFSGSSAQLQALLNNQQWTFSGSTAADEFTGGHLNDSIMGNAGNDTLDGSIGNDHLYGGAGADQLIGGAGLDYARYDDANYGNLVINLSNPGANTGAAAGDTFSGIECIVSGVGNDTVVGDAFANRLFGGGGNDIVRAGAGVDYVEGGDGNDHLYGGAGADQIVGGAGLDYARYDETNYGNLVIRLDAPSANTGAAAGDTYSGIECIVAGAGNDTVYGDAAANRLFGMGGNDTIDGRGGADYLEGGAGVDNYRFSTALGAGNVDTIAGFQHGVDNIMLHSSIFAGIGPTLTANEFGTATGAGRLIVYLQNTGQLFYDEGGAGVGAGPRHFATVTPGTVLDINDFVMV